MKLWMKYLIAIATGILAGFLIPWNAAWIESLSYLQHYSIHLGHYLLFPLVFFSLAIAVTQLRRYKKLGTILLRMVASAAVATVLFIIAGMLVTLIFSPDRIPILMQEDLDYSILHWADYLDRIIPENLFSLISQGSELLLPLIALSFLLGYHFFFDKEQAEPAFNFFDSLSRIFYRINRFFVSYAYIPLFLIAIYGTIQVKSIEEIQLYGELLLILSVASFITVGLIYPLILYFLGGRDNPLSHVYAILAPLLSALISGDIFFNYGILTRHIKENEGIPREVAGFSVPFLSLFARSGTALVASSSMLMIIGSYTSLEITFFQVLWVFLFSFLLSFALSAAPRMGIYVMLTLLCKFYGRGLEEGYMLLIPILPVLTCFSAFLDTAVVTLITRLTAFNEDLIDNVKSNEYI